MKRLLLLILCFFRPIFADVSLDGVSNFGWDLFPATAKNEKNTIFSPYSIYSCLSMTAAGAQGDTLKEMQKVLRLPANLTQLSNALSANNESLQGHLKIANSLWVAPKFVIRADFRKTIESDFHASVQSLDFSASQTAANTINQWIANHTDQKITQLFGPNDLQSSTRLVLANALYFSAKFLKPFNPKMTTAQSFWTDTDSIVKTPMMEQTSSFFYVEDETFQTVAIPMEAQQIAFVIFLPKEKVFSGLSSLMTSDKFKATLENLDAAKVRVRIPKFTLKERFDLNQILSQLGITSAFTPKANFSGIDGKMELYLSKVLHEAYFALDESGIVAAAATGASMSMKSTGGVSKEFIADHPFIFALVDLQTKIPLFLGELTTPP
ncbi:MAG TPA: serpin family protein [Rhabdochlamydiaceae bacterium]